MPTNETDDTAIGLGTHPLDQPLCLEAVEHARYRAGVDAHLAGQLDRVAGAAELEHPQWLPLRIGEIVLHHAAVDFAAHLQHHAEQLVRHAVAQVVVAAVVQRTGFGGGCHWRVNH
jgi:hypothetical protein